MDKETKKLIGEIFFNGYERLTGIQHENWEERKKFNRKLIEARKEFVKAEKNF